MCLSAAGQDATLFRNVRIFDGKGTSVSAPSNVLVRGNKIEKISTAPIAADNALVIDGGGRTLMRRAGAAHLSLRRGISQTSGHGDFRMPYETPRVIGGPLSYSEQMGAMIVADGPDEVRLRTREQLRKGATHIKLMAGGGVASLYDPLDVTQYSVEEIRAAVEAAENWGTYVTVHAYTPRAIRIAALADLILVNGDPVANFDLLLDPEKNFAVIMKDGKIYKGRPAAP